MKIVTPQQMKQMDLQTVAEGHCTSLQLMENAAHALYEELVPWLQQKGAQRVLLLAGSGHFGYSHEDTALLQHRLLEILERI